MEENIFESLEDKNRDSKALLVKNFQEPEIGGWLD